MKLTKKTFTLFSIFIVSIILYFNYRKYSLDKEVYHSEINGHIKSIRQVGRGDGYIQLNLKNENNFHPEAIIYLGSNNKNEIKEGDSISKRKNSYHFLLFKINNQHFKYYKTFSSKPE